MVLVGVNDEKNWLSSRWNLTYNVGWEHICKAAVAIYDYYGGIEILANGKPVKIEKKEDILNLGEQMNMVVRGHSKIVKTLMMITFYNQLNIVDVSVAKMTEEFQNTDYEKFNKSLGQYMDSIELAMYRRD